MKPLEKVAVLFTIIGLEKGRNIISLMDSDEIKGIISEIDKLMELSQATKDNVLAEFKGLGYEDNMRPSEILNVIRLLFKGSKIKR